jgi:hypothetical protein
MRQDDHLAHDRRPRGDLRGHPAHRRPRRQRRAAEGPRHRHGVPELRPLPAHERAPEHVVRAAAAQDPEGRDRAPRQRGGAAAADRPPARPPAARALRRSAPARGARSRHRARAEGLPDGRAALEPRRQAARRDARLDQQAAPPPRRHHRLRHPRPGRGHDDGHAHRRHEGRPDPAGREPHRALREAGEQVRGRLHGLARDELPGRHVQNGRIVSQQFDVKPVGELGAEDRRLQRQEGLRRHPPREPRPARHLEDRREREHHQGRGRSRRAARRRDPHPGQRRWRPDARRPRRPARPRQARREDRAARRPRLPARLRPRGENNIRYA